MVWSHRFKVRCSLKTHVPFGGGKYFRFFLCLVALLFAAVLDLYGDDSVGSAESEIVVFTAGDIEKMKVHSMVDLLNRIPGVHASDTGIEFRGFSTKNILVLLDGREINDPTSSRRPVNWGRIAVPDIETVEIHKAGAGGVYGDRAAGGLVRIQTKKIEGTLHGSLEGRYGRFNSHKYEAVVHQRMGDWGLNLSTNWDKTDGFRPNSEEAGYKLGSRLQYFYRPQNVFSLSLEYSRQDAEKPGPEHRLTPNADSTTDNIGASLVIPLQIVESETQFNLFDRNYENPDSVFVRQMKTWAIKQRLQWSPKFSSIGTVDFSTDFGLEHVSGLNIQSRDEKTLGLYGGKTFTLASGPFERTPLKATLGLRGNFHSEFPSNFNPSLRLGYRPGPVNISFTAKRFNTYPSFSKRYYETSTLRGNPDLQPEKGTNYNLGLSTKPTRSTDVALSFFYSHIDDRISYVREGSIATYENIGSATKMGIETSLKWVLNPRVQCSLGYTYLDAEDGETGKVLTFSPKHEAALNIELRPWDNLFVGLLTKYKSTRFINTSNTEKVEGTYLQTNVRAEYTFRKRYAFYVRVDNLLNADFHVMDGYPVTPIHVACGLKYGF